MTAALELSAIRKSFDRFLALDEASFSVREGEVHALLGENGAGKSSLMNVAAGLYAPDSGRMAVRGAEIRLSGPREAIRHRIGMVHQHFKLVKPFTVAENILLSNPRGRYGAGLPQIKAEIARHAEALGFTIAPDRRVDTLSVAEQQQAEILKVLVGGATIVILDEPTAVLTDAEAGGLLTTVRQLADAGAAIVLVTHKLHEVKSFADRVTVMRGGRTITTVDPRTISIAELTELTVGSTTELPVRASSARGDHRLNVAGLRCARADGHVMLNDASFFVRAGEIFGIAGVSGNGQAELAEALIGVREPLAGEIWVEKAGNVTHASPEKRRSAGIAAIPADRYAFALAGGLSIVENFGIGGLHDGRYGSWARIDYARMRADAEAAVRDFDVQGVRSLRQKAALLSGGNAQKLVIAREFSRSPAVVVAQSPSRGLDARACAAVHQRLLAAREARAAVVLISEDLDEVLALSDRIGVMSRGRIVAEFAAPADRQAVGRAMVGHA